MHLHIRYFTEAERSSRWQPWYSLETLKTSFNVSSEYQDCHPDDLCISVFEFSWGYWNVIPIWSKYLFPFLQSISAYNELIPAHESPCTIVTCMYGFVGTLCVNPEAKERWPDWARGDTSGHAPLITSSEQTRHYDARRNTNQQISSGWSNPLFR